MNRQSRQSITSSSVCALVSLLGLACGDAGNGTATASASGTTGQPTGAGATDGGTAELPTTDASPSDGSHGATEGADTTGVVQPGTTAGDTGPATSAGDSSSSGGIKFDVTGGDATGNNTTEGPMGKGSCRPSEIYGASGGFPDFSDPAFANFKDKAILVTTSNAQEDGFVLHIFDISGPPPPPNLNYLAPRYHNPGWTKPALGSLFGLTLDSAGNIYVASTTVYGPNPDPATIKRIDGVTGEITVLATLPNNGPQIGNINYDCVSETIYASNHDDGRIYQVDMSGTIVSTYSHALQDVTMGPANDPGEPNGVFMPLGKRPWAVQSHAGRLYYSIWWENSNKENPTENNEIWSVGYVDDSGVPDPTTAKKEFDIPPLQGNNFSNPVSDISFAATGWMLVSERTMFGDDQTLAHSSTTYEYDFNNGAWELKGTTFVVGELPNSAAGGVDHDFSEGGYVWMTGDALDFYTPDVVYGLQGTPHAGGDIKNSTLIDLDNEVINQDKTAMGDVEVPIPGDAMPVPPPQ